MTDFIALLEIAATIGMIVVPIVVLGWLMAGSDGPGLAEIFAIPAGPPLPRGVQEEEPVRYRVERLSRPRSRASDARPERRAPAGASRPAVESGGCG